MRHIKQFAFVVLMPGMLGAQGPIVSPRLLALSASMQAGDTAAESRFWSEVKGRTPLGELIPPRNKGDQWVTFLWRGDDSTTAVSLDAPLPPRRNQHWFDGGAPLSTVPGTHVWQRTEILPFGYRMSYTFKVTHRTRSGEQSAQLIDSLNSTPTFDGESVASGLLAPKQPWVIRQAGSRAGTLLRDSIFSFVLGQDRAMTVYLPASSAARADANLVVMLDGERYATDEPTGPVTLDNLISKKMIGPTIAVFVDSRRWDRTEDYSCNRRFADFIVTELVPLLRTKYGVRATAARTVIGGSSLGGLQSTCSAYWYPSVLGNVLSLSGSYFWFPDWPNTEQGLETQTGWLAHEMAVTTRRPIRLYLATGTFEGDGVPENRRMRDVLLAKGYPLTYVEYEGGHDGVAWRGLLADGLVALLRPGSTAPRHGARP
jgi:enterochelin esterase-like enzyme